MSKHIDTLEWKWITEELDPETDEYNDVEHFTTFTIEWEFIPGCFSGPYEDSYPDDYYSDIIEWDGEEPEGWVYEEALAYFDENH